jgi:hypothetical protein
MTTPRHGLPPIPSLRNTRVFHMAVEHLGRHRTIGPGACSCGRANCHVAANAAWVIREAGFDPLSYLAGGGSVRPRQAWPARTAPAMPPAGGEETGKGPASSPPVQPVNADRRPRPPGAPAPKPPPASRWPPAPKRAPNTGRWP